MNFLITGGAGSVGRDLTASLLRDGHQVRVLDANVAALTSVHDEKLVLIEGRLEDPLLVQGALRGIDIVIHLAWSFSDDPVELLEHDLKGHAVLLAASAAAGVSRLFYTSTAVVYGKPRQVPITEETPCLVADARKPFYAVAKLTAENLALIYGKLQALPVTIFRFWWSYGKRISGRHLREMIALAQTDQPIRVPAGAGGSFLDHEDLKHALLLAAEKQDAGGQIFNLATVYLTWADVARMIIEVTNSSSSLEIIPAPAWDGAQFLADSWELSTEKAARLFGYQSLFPAAIATRKLREAITPET